MSKMRFLVILIVLAAPVLPLLLFAQNTISFFITSRGPGDGANLGGLAGADKHCQSLAAAVGAGNRTWHAYPALRLLAATAPSMRAIVLAAAPGITPKASV